MRSRPPSITSSGDVHLAICSTNVVVDAEFHFVPLAMITDEPSKESV